MLGAVAGDIIGSIHEGGPPLPKSFPLFTPHSRFTDDTVLTVAVANAIRTGTGYDAALRAWGLRYPAAGYGGLFSKWLHSEDPRPYNSFGNGSAMRVSAVGWAFGDLHTVLSEAGRSASVTHDHPEGIKGAQAVAGAVFLGRTGHSKEEIRRFLAEDLGYDLVAATSRRHGFDMTCQGTVPAAAAAFLESDDFEGTIRNAVSLGGDADTLGCIAGAIAEAFYAGTPPDIAREVLQRLDDELREELLVCVRLFGVPL